MARDKVRMSGLDSENDFVGHATESGVNGQLWMFFKVTIRYSEKTILMAGD